MEIPVWILIEKSIEELGVDPRLLSYGSGKKVYKECVLCKEIILLPFRRTVIVDRCRICRTHNTNDLNTKQCNECKQIKPVVEFRVRKDRLNGLAHQSYCKECSDKKSRIRGKKLIMKTRILN